jgi:alkylated DNA repair protein (DNA oxidative demethylase)
MLETIRERWKTDPLIERNFDYAIVSVFRGVPAAVFLFGEREGAYKAARIPLIHGDAAVWRGEDRLHYHRVTPSKEPAPHVGQPAPQFDVATGR